MPKIERLFAFVVEDNGPDDEGVAAFHISGSSMFMPMIGADMDRVESLKSQARLIARATGKPVKLVEFSQRTELEVIEP